MKKEFLVVIGGAALVAAGLVGCGSDSGSEASSSSASSSASESASESSETSSEAAAASDTVVTIDGQPQDIQGEVNCNVVNDAMTIVIGDASGSGLTVIVSQADPPAVQSVVFGNVGAGSGLAYQEGTGSGSATATKDGNTYHVTGEAFSADIDLSNPMDATAGNKPFDISVTCP